MIAASSIRDLLRIAHFLFPDYCCLCSPFLVYLLYLSLNRSLLAWPLNPPSASIPPVYPRLIASF
jgi:hypothetical protein